MKKVVLTEQSKKNKTEIEEIEEIEAERQTDGI